MKDGSGETAQWFTVLAVLLLSSQHPHGDLQPSVTTVLGIRPPLLVSVGTRTYMVHLYVCRKILICIK